MEKYKHQEIDQKWQEKWEEKGLYQTGEEKNKPKYYVLDMFPYPSGDGLHVGHPKGYIATDVLARMKMMQGFNVLHPMGWDAFGLPAENYALKNKIHPLLAVSKNIATFKSQLKKIGFSYDWEKEINTTNPEYYKWTQWMFIKMFEKGLAHESDEPIIWCPSCQTGLAMEDLEDGKCERCGSEVERKPMRQWVIRITDYADRLLQDLDELSGWEESIKEMQRNWIGRSEGAEIKFQIANGKKQFGDFTVFTTRPDTLFGCTYCVVAPEHPLITTFESQISNLKEIKDYINNTKKKSDLERTDLNKNKTGVKIEGIMAVNPANREEVPIFIADYVLPGYGTGAIMAVPAHDARDCEFAEKYNIPINGVVEAQKGGFVGGGALIQSISGKFLFQKRDYNTKKNPGMVVPFGGGVENDESISETLRRELEEEINLNIDNFDYRFINLFESHNEPGKFLGIFYIKNVNKDDLQLSEGETILELSLEEALEREDVTPFTKNVIKSFQQEKCFPCKGLSVNSDFLNGLSTDKAKSKMIEWLEERGVGEKKVNFKLKDWVFSRQRYWGEPIPMIHCPNCGTVPVPEDQLPVILPEVEHYEPSGTGESPLAKIDDWVNTTCPLCGGMAKRETNTMPQWAGSSWYYLRYIDPKNNSAFVDKEKEKYWSPVDFYVGGAEHATRHLIYARFWHKFLLDIGTVNYKEPFTRLQHVGLIMAEDGRKMSKRWGNVINPDKIVEEFGADALRVYEMFMGPFGQAAVWNTNGLVGARKFLDRVWALSENFSEESGKELSSLLHKTIKKVGEDISEFKFNTAISALMILVNKMIEEKNFNKNDFESLLLLVAPFAPHLTEEIWSEIGHSESIFKSAWPDYNSDLIKDEEINLVVQINGKLRDTIHVASDVSEEEAKKIAHSSAKIIKWLEGKTIIKEIFIPGKLINIVIK